MLIEGQNIRRSFRTGERRIIALDDISVRCDQGEFLVLSGPSGSGKSTLLNILSGLDRPDAGEMRFRGRALSAMNDADLAELRNTMFGFVFQTPHLLPNRTVLENVALPFRYGPRECPERARKACMEMLEYVGLADLRDRLPGGLSGGEMQRVVFARALVREPAVIFADEPTGSLDRDNARRILDMLHAQTEQGRAVIMATHDEEAMGRGTRHIRLRKVSESA